MDLTNHELLRYARDGDPIGVSMALRAGAWTEFRRPVVNPANPLKGPWELQEDDHEGMTALMFAAQGGFSDIVFRLLKAGARTNAVEEDGWTALHFAAYEGHAEVCKQLVYAGAKLAIRNSDGRTPIDLAAASCGKIFAQDLATLTKIRL
mmetsp:Transcript_96676/g.211394  ORF Transcript_96676/g.211394 Transcript_96676/m.211394 type:complete len:150 (+) Transcript_96676:99-548(+)